MVTSPTTRRTLSGSLAALGRDVIVLAALVLVPSFAVAQQQPSCRVAVLNGEVRAGQTFAHPIGNGLQVILEPLPSGWILRVLPLRGLRGQHDYAELATPPYHSVSPVLISTDFGFRAQDALAWNPRHFRFAAGRPEFLQLLTLYDASERSSFDHQAQLKLAQLASRSPEAELTILEAHLVQGTGDQSSVAATVASHLNRSAHEVDQSAEGPPTPLGRLLSIRFRVRLQLPRNFAVAQGVPIEHGRCL